MMSDPTSVDSTTVDELTGKLVLLIEESRPWHDPGSMQRQLAAKVKRYVRYMRSKDFAEDYGRKPKDTIVRLVSRETPDENSLEFFQHVSYELSKHRVAFEHQVGAEGVPVTIQPTERPAAPPPRRDRMAAAATAAPGDATIEPREAPAGLRPDAGGAADTTRVEEQPTAAQEGEREPTAAVPAEASEEEPLAVEPDTAALQAEDSASVEAGQELDSVFALDDLFIEPPDEDKPAVDADRGLTPTFTDHREARAAAANENGLNGLIMEPSELERLIDGDQDLEFIDFEDSPSPSFEPTYFRRAGKEDVPGFFPEEEFGRALPESEDIDTFMQQGSLEPAVIETSSGKRIRLDVSTAEVRQAKRVAAEARPSLMRAVRGAAVAALVGSVAWGLLAVLAANGASLLALAVGAMVGISVRFQGNGRTMGFRLVGALGGLLGSLFGTALAATTLTASGVGFEFIGSQHPVGLAGIVELLTHPLSLLDVVKSYYGYLHVVVVAFAAYIAFRISVPGSDG